MCASLEKQRQAVSSEQLPTGSRQRRFGAHIKGGWGEGTLVDRAEQGDDEWQGLVLGCISCYDPGGMEATEKYGMEERSHFAQQKLNKLTAENYRNRYEMDYIA
jgi:hypothetical protein